MINALRFWESARLPFNLLIAAVVAWMFVPFGSAYGPNAASYIFTYWLGAWFAIANAAYFIVYPIDLLARRYLHGDLVVWRGTLWLFATTIAGAVTYDLMVANIGAALF